MLSLFQGKMLGHLSQYSVSCTCFSEAIFEKSNNQLRTIANEDEMKAYFATFASGNFTAKRIYKGYIDDPRNTDNAWIEAEIWNFHYGDADKLDENIPNVCNDIV